MANARDRKTIWVGITTRICERATVLLAFFSLQVGPCSQAAAAEPPSSTNNSFITEPLSRAEAITVALRQNPNILRAQKDVAAAQGVVIQTRAVAIPKVRLTGNYTAVEP